MGYPSRGEHFVMPFLTRYRRRWIAGFALAALAFAHVAIAGYGCLDRKSTRLNSSHSQISYAVFCLKKKNNISINRHDGRNRGPDSARHVSGHSRVRNPRVPAMTLRCFRYSPLLVIHECIAATTLGI